MEERIKDIYKCTRLKGQDPLVLWYNQVIEKRIDELTVSDIARCIRQSLFTESAVEMLLVFLLYNPYEGDAYGGELMEKLGEVDINHLKKHKDTIAEITKKAYQFIKTNAWECEDDKLEFEEIVNNVSKKMAFNESA